MSRADYARNRTLAADRRDAEIMAELGDRNLGRATLAPITLATIGLPWQEVQRIARECHGVKAREPGLGTLDHITLAARQRAVDESGTGKPGSVEEC